MRGTLWFSATAQVILLASVSIGGGRSDAPPTPAVQAVQTPPPQQAPAPPSDGPQLLTIPSLDIQIRTVTLGIEVKKSNSEAIVSRTEQTYEDIHSSSLSHKVESSTERTGGVSGNASVGLSHDLANALTAKAEVTAMAANNYRNVEMTASTNSQETTAKLSQLHADANDSKKKIDSAAGYISAVLYIFNGSDHNTITLKNLNLAVYFGKELFRSQPLTRAALSDVTGSVPNPTDPLEIQLMPGDVEEETLTLKGFNTFQFEQIMGSGLPLSAKLVFSVYCDDKPLPYQDQVTDASHSAVHVTVVDADGRNRSYWVALGANERAASLATILALPPMYAEVVTENRVTYVRSFLRVASTADPLTLEAVRASRTAPTGGMWLLRATCGKGQEQELAVSDANACAMYPGSSVTVAFCTVDELLRKEVELPAVRLPMQQVDFERRRADRQGNAWPTSNPENDAAERQWVLRFPLVRVKEGDILHLQLRERFIPRKWNALPMPSQFPPAFAHCIDCSQVERDSRPATLSLPPKSPALILQVGTHQIGVDQPIANSVYEREDPPIITRHFPDGVSIKVSKDLLEAGKDDEVAELVVQTFENTYSEGCVSNGQTCSISLGLGSSQWSSVQIDTMIHNIGRQAGPVTLTDMGDFIVVSTISRIGGSPEFPTPAPVPEKWGDAVIAAGAFLDDLDRGKPEVGGSTYTVPYVVEQREDVRHVRDAIAPEPFEVDKRTLRGVFPAADGVVRVAYRTFLMSRDELTEQVTLKPSPGGHYVVTHYAISDRVFW